MIRTYPAAYASDPSRWQQTLRDGDMEAGSGDRTVKIQGDQFVVEWADRLQAKLEADTSRIQSAQVIAKAINRTSMGKLHEIAQRVSQTKQKLSDEADKLAARLDQIDQKAPSAFANAHSILDQHHSDLDAMESELRQLSNLPLAESHNG